MKYIRKVTVIILALAFMLQPLPAKQSAAAVNEGISTQSESAAYKSVSLLIDSDGATRCLAYVSGESGTTKIAGTLKLKKGSTVVKSWNVSTTTSVLNVSKTCYLLSKGTYKLVLKVTVTRNGKSEALTVSTTKTY